MKFYGNFGISYASFYVSRLQFTKIKILSLDLKTGKISENPNLLISSLYGEIARNTTQNCDHILYINESIICFAPTKIDRRWENYVTLFGIHYTSLQSLNITYK